MCCSPNIDWPVLCVRVCAVCPIRSSFGLSHQSVLQLKTTLVNLAFAILYPSFQVYILHGCLLCNDILDSNSFSLL